MIVCGHGNVSDYCTDLGMVVADAYDGDISSYRGLCRVIVTDAEMDESEYYHLKSKMLSLGYELVSTEHSDSDSVANLVMSYAKLKVSNHPGRCKFGFRRVHGKILPHEDRMAVVKRIFELRDGGCSLHEIQLDEQVRHDDGRKLSISTIQLIIKNRDEYKAYS